MPSNLLSSGLRLLCLYLLITVLFYSCQKEEPFGLDQQVNPQASLLGESRLFFEQHVFRQAQDDKRLQAMPNNPRHRVGKTPVWDKAENVQLSVGAGLKVPLRYQKPISLIIGQNKEEVPLAELSYLLVYKDGQDCYHYEVVTQVPDADYWSHRHQPNRPFSGIIIVEDWWGIPLRSFKKSSNKGIMLLSSPSLISHKKKGEIQHMQAIADDCDVIVGIGPEGMYTVELLCEVNDGGGSGDSDSGAGGWGNPGGPEGEGDGGGGYGGPQPPDYEERPREGGGGGGRRRNDNPPPPDRPEINTPEEFLAEIEDSELSPCFKAVLADVKNLSNGSVAGIIQRFAGEVSLYNWEMKNGNLPADENASTNPIYNKNTGRVITIFDSQKFKDASDLAVARTIMHEAVHAYLVTYFATNRAGFMGDYSKMVDEWEIYFNWNDVHHEEFARSIVNQISIALSEYANLKGYDISNPDYFNDMAWGGLTETSTFKKLSHDQQMRIKNLLSSEQTGFNLENEHVGINGIRTRCNLIAE